MLPTLDLNPLEALGEDLYDSTGLSMGHDALRRAVRTRRLVRAGAIGMAGIGITLASAALFARPWQAAEPAQPPTDSWPDNAYPTSALIGAGVPWEEGLDGQAFIQTSRVQIEPDPSPNPNPYYRGTVTVPTGIFTYEQQIASGIDVVSAMASLSAIGTDGQAEYEFSVTNVTDRPLVLDQSSIRLVIEIPDDLSQWAYMNVSSTLAGDLFLHTVAVLPLGSLSGREPVVGPAADEGDLVLSPGETLAVSGVLDPLGYMSHSIGFSGTAPLSWSDLLDQYGDQVVLSVTVSLRGPVEGILDDLILVEHAVGAPATE